MTNPLTSLTPADLRRWLHAKAPTRIVGTAISCDDCLLAQWLRDILACHVSISYTVAGLTTGHDVRWVWMPLWMRNVAWAVDDLPDTEGTHDVTAAAALDILARVEREEGLVVQ